MRALVCGDVNVALRWLSYQVKKQTAPPSLDGCFIAACKRVEGCCDPQAPCWILNLVHYYTIVFISLLWCPFIPILTTIVFRCTAAAHRGVWHSLCSRAAQPDGVVR